MTNLVSTPPTRADQLRRAREAAGLSREDLALGLETVPVAISARSRADWIALMEMGVAEVTPEDLASLEELIATIAAAFASRAARPNKSAAA